MTEKNTKAMFSGSDASSICASSGSPPGSNLAVNDIQDWAQDVANDRSASGTLVSDVEERDIKIASYTLSFHDRILIDHAKVRLKYGQRYGLVGENGAGKSTLLQSIAARDIDIPQHIDIYLVSGEVEPSDMNPVNLLLASAKLKVANLEMYIEQLCAAYDVDDPALEAVYDELEEMDPTTFQAKADLILRGLGFTPAMMKTPTKDMAGGWRMRVAIARAIFVKPHLLLLDEPTNHLDPAAAVWLEAYLSTYNRILVITSHSQDFMDSICTKIIHLTNKKLSYHTGNYSAFVQTKEAAVNQTNPRPNHEIKLAHPLRFNFGYVRKLPPPIIEFDRVAFSYSGKKHHYLYECLSFRIDMDARIAIVGASGTGKTTLLQLITDTLQPSAGKISKHSLLKLVRYSQHSPAQLPDDKSPIQYLKQLFGQRFADRRTGMRRLRSQLRRFGLSNAQQRAPIRHLSDGQRARVVFAQLAMEHPDVLLLEEPTNHLDMASVEALVRAIKEFEGGVIIVSHDFGFISQVAEELWEVADRKIKNLTEAGISIVDYKNKLLKESAAAIERANLLSSEDALHISQASGSSTKGLSHIMGF
ncbi:P-loop containing nucleoside triphosphate hydrolase protein [Mycena vulgaris]|nr:P-loop containing nucleoside triphosphate hydrolase protein [Mycena vulgaris]